MAIAENVNLIGAIELWKDRIKRQRNPTIRKRNNNSDERKEEWKQEKNVSQMMKMTEEDTKGAVWQKLLPAERGVRINIVSSHPQSSTEKQVTINPAIR